MGGCVGSHHDSSGSLNENSDGTGGNLAGSHGVVSGKPGCLKGFPPTGFVHAVLAGGLLSCHYNIRSQTGASDRHVALGRNQPLKRERPKWKSDYPMTEGQLRSKRDEFWDTAPAFEGRKEIWDALRAAASAFESNDHLLAQAILDGASITLPHALDGALLIPASVLFMTVIYFSVCRVKSYVNFNKVGKSK
ncbi:Ubiquitin domain-containing protein 2 [Xenoophorus captivus]|uniref:Ubiquitin domain-containing protein 2 n=1 Tax=Xenoophorus captivus TaxID=1517983 RepID=A0ABV0QYJ1_9TELE